MTPLVTIVLPVYNGADKLPLAVNSIIMQTYNNWELIIIDDASIDNTIEVAKKFSDSDSRIRIIMGEKNEGLSARLNMGIDIADGKYLARMDHDDICLPDRIKYQVEHLERNSDIDLVAASTMVFRGDGEVIGRLPVKEHHNDICSRPWNGFYMPHPTWMGRIEWFRKYRYDAFANGAEDQHMLFRSYRDSKFSCLDIPLLGYREVRSLKKMYNARRIFIKAYVRECINVGNIKYAILITMTQLLKMGADILNLVFQISKMRNVLTPLTHDQQKQWDDVWHKLKVK